MTAEYWESVESGYFNCWSGQHPTSAVRTLDLYLKWRDGEPLPALASLPNLRALVVPVDLVDDALVDEIARTAVTSLTVTMGRGSVPGAIFLLAQLEELDLSGNELAHLPAAFDGLPRLHTLDLSHNDLAALPPLPLALTSLDVSFNDLTGAPAIASPLERLNLRANPIARLDVARLPRTLTELDACAALTEIPADLAALVALRVLAIGNPVRALPDLRPLVQLASLELSGQLGEGLFDQLPATLEELRGYGSHRVGIARIPAAIARLRRLRTLALPFDHITELARELRDVPLATLGLSSTHLADTPTYAHLPGTLQTLELANVGMTRVPPRIAELVQLRELVLSANPLAEIPSAVRALPHLARLDA